MAIAAAARLSLWTMAIATRAQAACANMQLHLTQFTIDWLRLMRSRRASIAFSSAATISRCATICPWLLGVKERVNRNSSANAGGAIFNGADRVAISGHSV